MNANISTRVDVIQKKAMLKSEVKPLQSRMQSFASTDDLHVQLATNSLTIEKDMIGFITSKKTETEFLSVESSKSSSIFPKSYVRIDPQTGKEKEFILDIPQVKFELSEVNHEYERSRYTFVDLLSDFGGFNDGLLLLAHALTGTYAASMFTGKLASTFPVQEKEYSKKQSLKHTQSDLRERIKTDQGFQMSA